MAVSAFIEDSAENAIWPKTRYLLFFLRKRLRSKNRLKCIASVVSAVNNACINIYADDVVIYASDKSIDVFSRKLQCTLQTVFNWYNDNKLSLSINKCSTMVIDLTNTG